MKYTNLPPNTLSSDSSTDVTNFFNNYYAANTNLPNEQLDSVITFFTNKGFESIASTIVGTIILKQAIDENKNLFYVLDTLRGLTDLQLSEMVARVLNFNRQNISILGIRQYTNNLTTFESRNVVI